MTTSQLEKSLVEDRPKHFYNIYITFHQFNAFLLNIQYEYKIKQ